MMADYQYQVTLIADEDGPEPELAERFITCATRRLGRLEEDQGFYPAVGAPFDIMDAFAGPFVWEMTAAEFEATPPSRVDLEIVSVDPVDRPAPGATVRVTVRVPS